MKNFKKPNIENLDIPRKIFDHLIIELEKIDLPVGVIEQLKKTILEEGNFSEQALRVALTPNSEL